MKIILTRDDISELIKNIFDIEAMCWNDDGSLTIDTVLEKLVNDKSKFNTDDLRKMLGRRASQIESVHQSYPIFTPLRMDNK